MSRLTNYIQYEETTENMDRYCVREICEECRLIRLSKQMSFNTLKKIFKGIEITAISKRDYDRIKMQYIKDLTKKVSQLTLLREQENKEHGEYESFKRQKYLEQQSQIQKAKPEYNKSPIFPMAIYKVTMDNGSIRSVSGSQLKEMLKYNQPIKNYE